MTWAEKYKLSLRLAPLALLVALSIILTRKTPLPTEGASLLISGTIGAKEEAKGASSEKVSGLPEFNYSLPLGSEHRLLVNMNISSIEEPENGAYWCGAPFLLDYHGRATASILDNSGRVEDEINLTAPSLVIGKPTGYDYYYYKTYDLDGDKQNNELIILSYSSCNGNWAKIVKADTGAHKFVTLPFRIDGEERDETLTGPHKEDLTFSRGRVSTKTYDMVRGLFSKREFIYKNGVFVQTSNL